MTETNKQYDYVIVGSGVGGLVSGALLGLEGHSVLVLEKNHQIGGSLQVFSRDKCIFDTGVHYIGSLDEGENLNKIFKYLGIMDDLQIKRLDEDCFDMIVFPDGKTYKHGQGYDLFKQGLLENFPKEGKAIDAFCDLMEEICDYFPLYNLEVDAPKDYINNPEVLSISAWDFVESITDDKRLQAVFLGSGPLYAGDRKTTPMYVVALIMNSYLKGSYRMVNGGSQIAKLLTKRIHALGGNVLKHQDVVSATYDENEIRSVITKNGEEHFGKTFISGIHPKRTIEIFGKDRFRAAYRHRIEKLENTVSSFMLYLSFHEESFPYLNYNMYAYNKDEVWETVDYKKEEWPESMFICTPAVKNQGEYAECLNVMAYMDYDEVEKWKESFSTIANPSERGESYEEFKRRHEELMIEQLEVTFPDIRKAIKNVYSSTPLTYKDYIGTDDGALYGILKDVNNITYSKINARTRVPNLFQTGQNLVFHGILGATIGSLVTCFHFIDSEELIHKINQA
ncbi:MAG: NAD(P)-binding protein [Crocinitomicaceae bacterium]|nr:NAD(P)-binding protein [Crocinitomicaceae bacterium]